MPPATIPDYIEQAAPEAQAKLRQMRTCIRACAPGAKEEIKWRMPAFTGRRILVMFAAFKHHIGFYPSASAMRAFKPKLTKYKTAKGSIQFPLDQPLPLPLIRQLTRFRVKESIEQDGPWRSPRK